LQCYNIDGGTAYLVHVAQWPAEINSYNLHCGINASYDGLALVD